MVEGPESVPSATLTDWANIADHVVTVHITAEEQVEPPGSETQEGETSVIVGRDVTMEVTDVLWSAEGAEHEAPRAITTPQMGWVRTADGTEIEEALHDASRIEVGEDYVVALAWKRAECADTDYYPARWSAIGSGGVLPMTDGIIGRGEFEGHRYAEGDGFVGPPLAQQFGGKAPEALIAQLATTPRTERLTFEGGNTKNCPQTGEQSG